MGSAIFLFSEMMTPRGITLLGYTPKLGSWTAPPQLSVMATRTTGIQQRTWSSQGSAQTTPPDNAALTPGGPHAALPTEVREVLQRGRR